jgi:hypothetical protein
MWIKDKFGQPINMDHMSSIVVAENTDGGFQVEAWNTTNTTFGVQFAEFLVGPIPVSQADATALRDRIGTMLGVVDLNV